MRSMAMGWVLSNSGCILKAMQRGFADRSGVRYERKRKIKDASTSSSPLSNWKNGVIVNTDGKTTEKWKDYKQ